MITIPESLITIPGISDHDRPESAITMLRITHLRIAPDDGFPLREIVSECIQQLEVKASELTRLGIEKPDEMPSDLVVRLQGGLALVFDEYGRVKFSVSNKIYSRDKKSSASLRQTRRLKYLWEYGYFRKGASLTRRFSALHRQRAMGAPRVFLEGW